uniref:SGNH hydrolase-type esterase domain-containing protein n=1 Tax=Salix viminalis TaxID=40686 RepID=A0A6N2M3X3_SALVM
MVSAIDQFRQGAAKNSPNGAPKLFVFGDSYVDTGNWPRNVRGPWKVPYGKTFPGKPNGRASDGRVLTDHIASFLGIESPTPYQLRNTSKNTRQGLNFALGGSGIFPSWKNDTLTVQIDRFEQLLKENVYSRQCDLEYSSSVALVSSGSNDYSFYAAAKKGSKDKSTFVVLDLYNAMVSAIDQFRQGAANTKYKNPLQPCCSKIVDFICSAEGVCPNPKSSFFFDLTHPSDNGWNAIFSFLQCSLNKDLKGLPAFTKGLVKQLAADLQRINRLGVKKVVVATLPVIGCLPIHNPTKFVSELGEKTEHDDGKKSTFVVLDLYNAMVSAIDQFRKGAGNFSGHVFSTTICFLLLSSSIVTANTSTEPLQPCCSKLLISYAQRKECARIQVIFLFDLTHPSDNGWNAIFRFCNVLSTKI